MLRHQIIESFSALRQAACAIVMLDPYADIAAGKARRDQQVAAQAKMQDEGWRRKDGSVFWANVVMTPVRDAQGELRGFAKLTAISDRNPAG